MAVKRLLTLLSGWKWGLELGEDILVGKKGRKVGVEREDRGIARSHSTEIQHKTAQHKTTEHLNPPLKKTSNSDMTAHYLTSHKNAT